MISDVNFLLLLLTLLSQIILAIFNFQCNASFYFSILQIVFCWLIVCTSTTRTSCISISNVFRIMYVDEAMLFTKNLVDYHALFNFFDSCHHLHVFARQTTRRQHIVLRFFNSLQTFHQFFWWQHFQILFFFCFLILNIIFIFFFFFMSLICWLILIFLVILKIVN